MEYRQLSLYKRLTEILIWCLAGLLIFIKPLLQIEAYELPGPIEKYNWNSFFGENYLWFITAIMVSLFPSIFRLIFGFTPIEYIRYKNKSEKTQDTILNSNIGINTISHLDISYNLVCDAKLLSEKIFTRSNVYLLLGSLIALVGILVFYFQSTHLGISPYSKDGVDYSQTIILFLPRFGALIFIEAIAFFFLRQFKVTMEEYRYYESIKRQRENQLQILKLLSINKDLLTLEKITRICAYNENPNVLKKDETTQIIEAAKQNNESSNIMDKIIDILKTAKK